jgi:hypothetical protein
LPSSDPSYRPPSGPPSSHSAKFRGGVGTTSGIGNLKRYSHNTCALTDPPPYFPTTGHFAQNRFYEIDPAGFNVVTWFATYQQ